MDKKSKDTRTLVIVVPKKTHQKLKMASFKQERSMAKIIRELINEYV